MSKEKLYTNLVIAVCIFIAQYVQTNLLYNLYIAENTSLFYLPAVVVIIATLIAPYYSALGLFVGETIAIWLVVPNNDFISAALKASFMAAGSLLTAMLLIRFSKTFKLIDGPKANLDHLDAYDVMLACAIYAIITNIIFRVYFVHYIGISQSYSLFGLRIFGDFTGAFLIFIALNFCYLAYSFVRRRLNSQ